MKLSRNTAVVYKSCIINLFSIKRLVIYTVDLDYYYLGVFTVGFHGSNAPEWQRRMLIENIQARHSCGRAVRVQLPAIGE